MNPRDRVACVLAFVSILSFATLPPRGGQVNAFWNPDSAKWNAAASWTPAVIPNNGASGNTYRVFTDNGNATNSIATLNLSPTINQLTVSLKKEWIFP